MRHRNRELDRFEDRVRRIQASLERINELMDRLNTNKGEINESSDSETSQDGKYIRLVAPAKDGF